jgi:hypothetical protein
MLPLGHAAPQVCGLTAMPDSKHAHWSKLPQLTGDQILHIALQTMVEHHAGRPKRRIALRRLQKQHVALRVFPPFRSHQQECDFSICLRAHMGDGVGDKAFLQFSPTRSAKRFARPINSNTGNAP